MANAPSRYFFASKEFAQQPAPLMNKNNSKQKKRKDLWEIIFCVYCFFLSIKTVANATAIITATPIPTIGSV